MSQRSCSRLRLLEALSLPFVGVSAVLTTGQLALNANGQRLFDHTSVLCGSNLGNANNHDYRNLPIIVADGGFDHGRYVSYDRQNNVPLSNLSLALLHNIGIEVPAFGASRGRLVWS